MSIKNLYPETRPSLDLDFAASKSVDPRVTFTRTSTATYYDGVTVAKAEENLFGFSNDLTNAAWAKAGGITITPNAGVAQDGSSTAARVVVVPGSFSVGQVPGLVVGQQYVLSFYVKSNTGADQTFTSMYGTGVQPTHIATTSWTRVVRVFTAVSGSTTVYPLGNTSNTDNLDLLVDDFQLENRDVATDYTPTTTQPITRYQPVLLTAPANVPRINHDPVTRECLGLLIEEARTNLLTYSSGFDNAVWTKVGVAIDANVFTAPDGTITADKLIANSTNSVHKVTKTVSLTQNSKYTYSKYVKAAGYNGFVLNVAGGSAAAMFNLTAGTVTTSNTADTSGVSAAAVHVGNGIYRCSISFTWAAVTGGAELRSVIANDAANALPEPTFVGDNFSGVYIWGAQFENAEFPTSYIPTTSAQVTRAADDAIVQGADFSSWFNNSEGTLYAEVLPIGGASSYALLIGDTHTNRLAGIQYQGGAGTITKNAETYIGATIYNKTTGRPYSVSGISVKLALGYALGSTVDTSVDGDIQNGTLTLQGAAPSTALRFGKSIDTLTFVSWTGHFRRVTYWPEKYSAQLPALTM